MSDNQPTDAARHNPAPEAPAADTPAAGTHLSDGELAKVSGGVLSSLAQKVNDVPSVTAEAIPPGRPPIL